MPPNWLPLFSALLFLAAYLSIFLSLGNRILIIIAGILALVISGVLKITVTPSVLTFGTVYPWLVYLC